MFKGFGKDDHKKEEGEKDKDRGFSFSFGKKDASPPKPRGPSVAELQEQIENMEGQMSMLTQERRKEVTFDERSFLCDDQRFSHGPLIWFVSGHSLSRAGKRACKLQGCTRSRHLLRRYRCRLGRCFHPALSGKLLPPRRNFLLVLCCALLFPQYYF